MDCPVLPDTSGDAARCSDSNNRTSGSTVPYSTGHIERLLHLDVNPNPRANSVTSDATNPFPTGFVERQIERAEQEKNGIQIYRDCPAALLESPPPNCRVLVCHDPEAILSPNRKVQRDWHIFRQTRDSIYLSIWKPNHVEIWFDPGSDNITVRNPALVPLFIKDRWDNTVARLWNDNPYEIAPGIWLFNYGITDSFTVVILPRTHILEVRGGSGQGSKRNIIGQPKPKPLTSLQTSRPVIAANLGNEPSSSRFSLSTKANGRKEIDYEVWDVQRVGSTGSANVFRARHSGHSKVIVIKALKTRENLVHSGRSWQHEVNMCKKLPSDCVSHSPIQLTATINKAQEYIVKFVGSDARLRWLLFDEANGSNLASPQWRDRQSNNFTGTIYQTHFVVFQLASALAFLYDHSMLHNDVKPGNVVFHGTKATLIDFGLATDAKMSICNGGTPWYVPPEYATRRRSFPSDVWALGIVTLYLLRRIGLPELSRQTRPWEIKDVADLESEASKQMQTWIESVREVADSILAHGGELQALTYKMLERRARNRITASDLVCRMEALKLQGVPTEPASNRSTPRDGESGRHSTSQSAERNIKRRK